VGAVAVPLRTVTCDSESPHEAELGSFLPGGLTGTIDLGRALGLACRARSWAPWRGACVSSCVCGFAATGLNSWSTGLRRGRTGRWPEIGPPVHGNPWFQW